MTAATTAPSERTTTISLPSAGTTSLTSASTATKYRLAAIDLDGTLLRSDHKLSARTKETLRRLHAKGFFLMIATGRSMISIYEIAADLQLPLPIVCSNGARGVVCDTNIDENGKVGVSELFYNPVPESVVQRTILEAREMGYVVQYHVNDDIYANPTTEFHRSLCERYMRMTGVKTIFVEDEFEATMKRNGLPYKILVLCAVSEQDAMLQHFARIFEMSHEGEPPSMVRGPTGWFMEVLHPTVCKGNGLAQMCHHIKVDINEVVAFGDASNDYEFLQIAGKGIVMKNGSDVVKRVANEVIDLSNNEDGVVRTLESMEQDGCLIFDRKDLEF